LSNYHRPRLQTPLVWGEAGAALGIIAGPLVGALFVHFSAEGWLWFFHLNAGLALVAALFAQVGLRGRPLATDDAEAAEHPSTPRQVRVMTLWQVAVSILIVGAGYLFSDYTPK
jgi:MFS family permease